MGKCLMHHIPAFCDSWFDGSSLTTGGAVNPTSTIGALAVRCGESIKRRFGDITTQKTTPSNADAPDL